MLTTEKTRGIITFHEKEYSFLMDNNILQILPGSKKQQQDFKNRILNNLIKQWDGKIKYVPTKILKGITDTEENIEILVSDKESNFNGFISYSVIAYMKLNKKNSIEEINKIRLTDDLLKYCISPKDYQQAFMKYTGNEKIYRSIEYPLDKNLETDLGCFNFENNKISVKCNVLLNIDNNLLVPLSTDSYINFCLEKASDFINLLQLIHNINNSFKFIYRNINAIYDSFILYNNNNKCGEIKLTDKLIINQKNIDAIDLKLLGKSYSRILEEIGDNHFTLNHIPRNKPNSYTPSRKIDIFEAFESEFSMYPESSTAIRSEEFLTIREEISTLIKEKIDKNTGHKKRCYKDLFNSVNFTSNNISQKYKFAITKNKNIINPVLNYYFGNSEDETIEELTRRTNKIRNSIAHGHLDFEAKPEDIFYIKILEILIYTMELGRVEVSENDIRVIISELFHLNIRT